ncbi:hypothetical protein C8R44DRAFT_878683 [Mycena epipterygia]|nr:hypothetical protein C8R44DRAFT_878683 [Mycena epipterygia]
MDVDTTLNRVDELWFSDSGLVVQAENSLFRVSGAVLAARSPVFKDMLSFPQPPDSETIEGCPVVKLPDSAADITRFFRAIFDSSFFETYPTEIDTETVLSILHLSNKYVVNYLQRRALVHLSSRYSTTLSGYTQSFTATSLSDEGADISPHVATIYIARKVNALWILPAAFYLIAQADDEAIDKILDCVPYANESAALSGDDRITFLRSSLQITRGSNELMSFLTETITGCTAGQNCIKARLCAVHELQSYMKNNREGTYNDPLAVCEESEIWDNLANACCLTCYKHLTEAHQVARQRCWDQLPTFCGLPPWEELEKMKASALEIN